MRAQGICLQFDCSQNRQYEEIGRFWEIMRQRLPSLQLAGIGFGWQEGHLQYLIGQIDRNFACQPVNEWFPEARMQEVILPDENWEEYECRMDQLASTYARIWRKGRLDFEIERFEGDRCLLMIHYAKEKGEKPI